MPSAVNPSDVTPKRRVPFLRSPKGMLLLVVVATLVAAAVAVPLAIIYMDKTNRTSNSGYTVRFGFTASGNVEDYADGAKQRAILNVISSAAGLGSSAPAGSKLEVNAGSVDLEAAIPVVSETVADSAIAMIESTITAPADLIALLVANGVDDVTIESTAAAIKEAGTDEAAMISPEDTLLLGKLQLVNYDSCRTLARSLQIYPGSNYGAYLSLSERYSQMSGPILLAEVSAMSASASTDVARSAPTAAAADSGGGGGAESFSSTNVQVAGVDESDIVKNDGSYIYSIGGGQLVIVRAYPSEERTVVSRTSLREGESAVAAELFAAEEALLDGDLLMILSAAQLTTNGRRFAGLLVQTWDVADRSGPRLVATSVLEGTLLTARLLGGYAFIAISSAAHLPDAPAPMPPAIDVMPIALPSGRLSADGSAVASELDGAAAVAECDEVSYVPDVQPRSLLTVVSVALSATSSGSAGVAGSASVARTPGEQVSRQTVATGSSWREASVYASHTSLYVATYNSQWNCEELESGSGFQCADEAWWCVDRRRLLRTLRHASWWDSKCSYSVATYIIAYTIGADGSLVERAKGAVPGYLLSQWSLDEHAGHLRVAYTVPAGVASSGSESTSQTDNGVDVLDATTLNRVGRVRGLGAGERIYAMRFAGDLGYMVTFRQVDPLYTLSLSDPTRPTVLGELKIPGYSDYLHPVDATTLLGIGQAGDDAGRIRGVKLGLFDISDLANPIESASLELGGRSSYTLVSDDHKALLFDKARQLLVLPITEREGYDCDAPPSFHGAKVFTLDAAGFKLRAAIEHGPNRSSHFAFPEGNVHGWACASDACASAAVRRSLYIGDDLFTISDGEIRTTSLTSYESVWSAPNLEVEVLTREGACTLNGQPVEWSRVAASGDDIWCDNSRRYSSSPCRPADTALRERSCSSNGWRSFDALLTDAISPCGKLPCANETVYNPCSIWF